MLDLKSLNELQLQAVKFDGRALLLLAGPGSGKTHTITQRILYLLSVLHVPPEQILVITFTKDAAKSMQNRFLKAVDSPKPVTFGTFHSVFYYILRESRVYSQIRILDTKQKKKLLLSVLCTYISDEKEQQNMIPEIMLAISYYKNTLDEQAAQQRFPKVLSAVWKEVFSEYEMRRKQFGYIDFDDMVFDTYLLLKSNPAICTMYQTRFPYILLDEFQDINPVQYCVLCLLCGRNSNIFAVGDDDQSIYGFRGSRPECLASYEKDFMARRMYLNENYRSTAQIVMQSLQVINQNKNRYRKELTAHNKLTQGIYEVKGYESAEQQNADIVDNILKMTGKSGLVCMLFRTNLSMQTMAAYLTKRGIAYSMKEKVTNIYEHFIIKDICTYLKLIYDEENATDFAAIINKPLRYINKEALATKRDILKNAIKYYIASDVPHRHERIRALQILQKDLIFLKNKSLFLAIEYIRKKMGYEKYLMELAGNSNEKKKEFIEVLEWLSQDCKNFDTWENYSHFQKAYAEVFDKGTAEKVIVSGNENEIDRNVAQSFGVELMTVHSSKGLEFETVIIPNCNEGVFPYGKILSDKEVEEERRLFYVGMTRAKRNLYLLYLKGTSEKPVVKSRFLPE